MIEAESNRRCDQMKRRASFAISLLSMLCILLFTGCAGTVEKSPMPSESVSPSARPAQPSAGEGAEGQSVTLSTYFRREDGTPLSGRSIRLSDGENSMDYPLDEEGQLQVTGFPKAGVYTVSVLEDDEETGTIALNFSVGSVIDAATNADGVGHVTVKEDTDTVSLDFILDKNGALTCSLRLSANEEE